MVGALLKGHIQGNDLLSTERTAAQAAAATELTDLFGQNFPPQLLAASFTQVTYTDDPLAATMLTEDHAHRSPARRSRRPAQTTRVADRPFRPPPPEQTAARRRAAPRIGMTCGPVQPLPLLAFGFDYAYGAGHAGSA